MIRHLRIRLGVKLIRPLLDDHTAFLAGRLSCDPTGEDRKYLTGRLTTVDLIRNGRAPSGS